MIYEELCRGRIESASRDTYAGIIADLARDGAEAVILGCTEIGLLIGAADSPLPVFDTTDPACRRGGGLDLRMNMATRPAAPRG